MDTPDPQLDSPKGTETTTPLHEDFVSTVDEPLQSMLQRLLLLPDAGSTQESAAIRVDRFEIELRQETLHHIRACLERLVNDSDNDSVNDANMSSDALVLLQELGEFWEQALRVCLHLVHFASQATEKSTEDVNESNSIHYHDITIRKQLPIILLEDVVDTLPCQACWRFWEQHVVPSYKLLFGDDLWWTERVCWLPFLKVANKLLRRRGLPPDHAAALMQTMARIYPLSEKSAVKVWGSHNIDNVTELETQTDFEKQQTAASTTSALPSTAVATTSSTKDVMTADYSFYESFWKLQQDFHNPYAVSVADFLKRLGTFLTALESHKPVESTAATMNETTYQRHVQKYLTASRLLPLQLQDPDFRIHVLTQLLLIAGHLTSQVASLGPRLQEFVVRAKKLLQAISPHGPYHLQLVESILSTLEPQWRRWKQNKCQPDLEHASEKKRSLTSHGEEAPPRKRRLLDGPLSPDDSTSYQLIVVPNDLPQLSSGMRQTVPALENHLTDYVEALDPESGIEAEYHPANDKLFTWRALRLLSVDHLGQFDRVGPNGDLEPAVRHIYKEEKDIDIPGEAHVYAEQDDDDEVEEETQKVEAKQDEIIEDHTDDDRIPDGSMGDDDKAPPESTSDKDEDRNDDDAEPTDVTDAMEVDKNVDESADSKLEGEVHENGHNPEENTMDVEYEKNVEDSDKGEVEANGDVDYEKESEPRELNNDKVSATRPLESEKNNDRQPSTTVQRDTEKASSAAQPQNRNEELKAKQETKETEASKEGPAARHSPTPDKDSAKASTSTSRGPSGTPSRGSKGRAKQEDNRRRQSSDRDRRGDGSRNQDRRGGGGGGDGSRGSDRRGEDRKAENRRGDAHRGPDRRGVDNRRGNSQDNRRGGGDDRRGGDRRDDGRRDDWRNDRRGTGRDRRHRR